MRVTEPNRAVVVLRSAGCLFQDFNYNMSSAVSKMFSSEDDGKVQIEFDNCSEDQRDNDEEVGTEEELIDLVKACPILYDVRLKVYKDRHLKDSAWRSVAASMKLTVSESKNKWKNIRDAYVKYLHASKDENNVAGRKLKKRYKFADKMNFLDKCIQHRNPPGNYQRPRRDSTLHQNSLSMVVNYADENRDHMEQLPNMETPDCINLNSQHVNDQSPSEKTNAGQGKVAKQDLNEEKNERKRKLEVDKFEDMSQQATVIDEHDDSKLFCLSLISTLKRLSARRRQLAKLKIQNVLYEIEFSEDS